MSGRILTPAWTRLRALLLGALLLFTVAPTQAQTVDPVTNLNAHSGDMKLWASWIPTSQVVTDFRGGVFYSYYIRWKVQNTSTWLNPGGADGEPRTFDLSAASEITGLTNDTTYEVGVRIRKGAPGEIGTYSSWASTTGTPRAPAFTIPTVSLSASPNPVTEGSSVTVTATLSNALPSNVMIPVTITDDTAEPADHGTLAGILISSGATTGTGTITTSQDADEDDETFTVALGSMLLPVLETARMVQIRISDDDKTFVSGVPPTVPEPPPGGDDSTADPNRARVQEAVKRALAAVARRAMASTLDNIGARFGDIGMSGLSLAGQRVSLQDLAVEDHGSGFCTAVRSPTCAAVAWGRSMTARELFAQSGFSVHLGGSENGLSDPSATLWSVWGRGDLGTFAGRGDARQRYDGELRTGWLGIDARAGSWVAGLAVSHGEGDADYNFAGDGLPGKGRLDTKLTAIYPYGRWKLGDSLELHGVAGVGTGDARHKPQDGETESGDLSMHMASVGIRRAFPELAGMALAMRADASVTRIETDDGPDDIHRLSADSWRLRAGMEASRHFELERDAAFEPFLEAAFRQDGGDGLDGSGVELAGGLRYVAPRMFIEARGRWLATHSDEGAQEQSVSLTARAGPGADGRGLFIALNPRWGAATGGAKTLWNEEMANPQGPVNKGTMDAQLGYGFVVPAQGVLTPFVEAGLAGDDHRRLRLGTRFEASREALRLELVGERSENETARPEHALRLDLRLWY